MAYVSLYRKYRPQTFADVVGQDHVTTTLSQAVTGDHLHHAYLFTGPRGTGKTSTARILAKAINCEKGPRPDPCGECVQCQGITEGSSVDVIEIDAASHGGVDDVRDLRDRVAFAPASARMKVYIVDECHMLSTAGWNAFLKTVEEPPGHVVFVFATTEPHKVLETILSRTQRFDFKRVSAVKLAEHVGHLGELESVTFEPGSVDLIVRAGDGSVRDTMSVLEQVIAFTGDHVTLRGVIDVLGAVPEELLLQTADLIGAGDVAGLCALVGRLGQSGVDLRQFARDAVAHLRELFLIQVAPEAGLVETTQERLALLQAQAGRLGRMELLRAVDLLAECQAQMRRGNTRLPLEMALIKSALPEASGDPAALAARLDRLERRTGVPDRPAPAAAAAPAAAPTPAPELLPTQEPAPVRVSDPAAPPERAPAARPAPAAAQEPAPARVSETDDAPPPQQPQDADDSTPAPARAEQPAQQPVAPDPPARAEQPREQPAEPDPPAPAEQRAEQRAEQPAEQAAAPDPPAPPASAGAAPAPATAPAAAVDLELVQRSWDAILDDVKVRKRSLQAWLLMARPVWLRGETLGLEFRPGYGFHADNCARDDSQALLGDVFDKVLGVRLHVDCKVAEGDGAPEAIADDHASLEEQAEAVLESERAAAAGELPDDAEAHDQAIVTLTHDLGAVVLDDNGGSSQGDR